MDEATRDLVEGLLKVAARDDMPLGIKIAMRRSAAMIQRLAAEVERYESMDQLRRFDSKGRDVTELTGLWDESDSFDFRPLRDKEADRGRLQGIRVRRRSICDDRSTPV